MYINTIAFVLAAIVYFILWGVLNSNSLTAILLPALIMITGAAIYTYKPLLEKTIHRDK